MRAAKWAAFHSLPAAADAALTLDAATTPTRRCIRWIAIGPSKTSSICVAVMCSGGRASR